MTALASIVMLALACSQWLSSLWCIYTPEDLLTLPDYGRFELLDGHLVKRKMGTQSSYAATNVLILIGHFVRSNNLGLVFQADCGYQIFAEDPGRVRFADASFICRGRLPEDRPPQGHCRLAPDLVIDHDPHPRHPRDTARCHGATTGAQPQGWLVRREWED